MALEDILKNVEDTGNAVEKTGNQAEKTGNQAEKAAGQVQDFKDMFADDDDFDINATVTVDTSQAQQAIDNIPKDVEIKATVVTQEQLESERNSALESATEIQIELIGKLTKGLDEISGSAFFTGGSINVKNNKGIYSLDKSNPISENVTLGDIDSNQLLGTVSDYVANNIDSFIKDNGEVIPQTIGNAIKLMLDSADLDTDLSAEDIIRNSNALKNVQNLIPELMDEFLGEFKDLGLDSLIQELDSYLQGTEYSGKLKSLLPSITNANISSYDLSQNALRDIYVDQLLDRASLGVEGSAKTKLKSSINSELNTPGLSDEQVDRLSAALENLQTKQSSSKTVNPLAKELSQLADNARQAANETIGKSSSELQQIVAEFNKQFNDIRSKEGYQADSKETKSAQAAISKLVTATEKRRREELSETRSTKNEAKLQEGWRELTKSVQTLKSSEQLRLEAAGSDDKLAELINTESLKASELKKDIGNYNKVAKSDERSAVKQAIQKRLDSYKALTATISEAAQATVEVENVTQDVADTTEEDKLNDALIEARRFVSNKRKERTQIEATGSRSELTSFNEEALAGINNIIDSARAEDGSVAPELLDVTNTFIRETYEKLNQATKGLVKDYFTKEFDGDLKQVIDALGNPEAVKELGINNEQIANALSKAEAGSSLGDAVSSALDAVQAEKKKVADQERKEVEDLRKIWKDALKADVVTAQSNVNNATTQEDREAAQAQLVKASERYENFLGNVQAAGSDITSDEEIAKAKAATAKAAADLKESLEGVSEYCKEYIKSIEDQVKAITSDKSLSADEKAFKIQQIQRGYGYTARNEEEAKAVAEEYGNIDKLTSDLMRASQAEDELKQKALDVAAANRKIAEADTTDKQITEHRNLASIYRQQAAATTDVTEREKLLTQATNEEAKAQAILDKELAKARQIAKDAQQAFMQIVDMVNSATNKVIGLIRSSIGLANKGVNATVNGGKKIVSTLGRVVQLFGSLSNRVRSCIAAVINFARSTTQALGRVLNGVRSLIAHFNIFNRQAAGKNGLSLVFTELNSAISLAERAFNGLFNNQLLAKSIKFDSTIASITMLLGGEATDDTQRFASALQDAFGISYSQTISDLQEITSLLKAAGLEASGLTGTGIANAAQDLYAISQYFGALGMAGGSAAEVMNKLESGMKGMTQSIDDLGLSVRESDMNEFLKGKGYNIKFSNLSEANKETVRLAAILGQFKNNFNIEDYTKLLDQPYYQISLIKSQITEIGTIIGKIFQGIIGKYLPYILGALNFVRTQLEGLAGKLGIDLSGDKVQESLEGVKDTVDGITDSEKKAAKAAKDYTGTAGFDEITSLNSDSSDQDMNLSDLLADVGSISDKLQGVGADQKSLVEELKEKWSKFVKDTLGEDVDPFFGFNMGKAKTSLKNIGKNVQRWWKSFKETTLTLGLKFANDIQIGRFVNDVLNLVDAITQLAAIIQERLSPIVQDFYDKHLSKYIKAFGDNFHKFSKDFKKRVNQLDKDLKGGMTFGDAWKKNFGNILPPDLQKRLEKIVKIVKTLYEEYITPIKDAVLTTFDTMGTLSMGGLNIVDSTITKGEDGESLLDKVLGNYQTLSKDKLQPWIESTTNSIASYIETHKTEIANLIDQIANDLFDVFTMLADIVGKLITWNIENPEMLNTIAETAKKVLGFVSDNFDTIMRIVELFVQLISASIEGLLSGIQIIFDKIAELDTVKPGEDKSQLQDIIDRVCEFIEKVWTDLGTGISNLLQWVSDNEGKVDKALSAIEGIVALFSEHIVGVIEGILAIKAVTGLAKLGKNLKDVAGGLGELGSFFGLTKAGAAGAAGTAGSAGAAGAKGAAAAAGGGLAGAAASLAVATGIVAAAGIVAEMYADAIWEKLSAESGILGFAATEFSSGWNTIIGILYQVIGKLTDNAEMMEKGDKLLEEANGKSESVEGAHLEQDLAQIAQTYFNSEDEGQKEWARYMLNEKFGITPEMLEPYMKSTEDISGNMIKLLDTTQTITTGDGKVLVNVPGLEDPILLAAAQQTLQTENQEALSKNVNSGLSDIQSSLGSSEKLTDRTNGLLSELTENVKGIWGDLFKSSDNDKESLPKNKKGLVEVAVAQMVDGSVPSSVIEQQKRDLTDLSKKQLKRKIKIRALGGSVPSGQLFIANEAGNPELIGQIGKKTGADVANRGMITDAMETAVYNGLVDALNQSRQQATTGTSTPTTINVNGFGLIDKNALRQFAKILAPYLSANKDSFITA